MNINLHIERLILDKLPLTSRQGLLVQATVQTELARLLTEQGLTRVSATATPYLSGGPIQLASDSKSSDLGHHIAQAIYTSFESTLNTPRRTTSFRGPGA